MNPVRRVADAIRNRLRGRVVAGWGNDPAWRRAHTGFWMQLGRAFDDRAYYFGGYDDAFVRDAPRLVRAGDRCVDVGAQKGFFAMVLARCVGPTGAVLAVEADPEASALLAANVTRNGFDRVRIVQCAAADRTGDSVTFHMSHQVGWSSRFPNQMQAQHVRSTVTVPTRTVDDLVTDRLADVRGPVALVKVDVEGSELLVLRGMHDVLAVHTPILWMEVNRLSLTAAGASPSGLEAELVPYGYRFFLPDYDLSVFGRTRVWYTPVAHLDNVERDQFDIVAIPPRHDAAWAAIDQRR